MKVWITKYALTQGVFCVEGRPVETGTDMLAYGPRNASRYVHKEGRDWHRTLEAAMTRAEQLRQTRIAALTRQLAQVTKMKIRVVDAPARDDAGIVQ